MDAYDDENYSDDFEEEEPQSPLEAYEPKRLEFRGSADYDQIIDQIISKKKPEASSKRSSKSEQKDDHRFSLSTQNTLTKPIIKKIGFSPRDREMSAYRNTIRTLRNKLADEERQMEDLRKDNRLLNRLRVRQEKDLNRFQAQEGELPQLLTRHAEEVRALREHLKRSLQNSQNYQKESSQYRQEILKLRDQNKKLEAVSSKKNLLGRDRLTNQLQLVARLSKEKEEKIVELDRRLELELKSHQSEVRVLKNKNKQLSLDIEEIRQNSETVHSKLKEKEKNLDVMNMYAQRFGKLSRQLSEAQSSKTFATSTQTQISCPPMEMVSFGRSSASSSRKVVETISTQTISTDQSMRLIKKDVAVQTSSSMDSKAIQTLTSVEQKPPPSLPLVQPTFPTTANSQLPTSGIASNAIEEEEQRKKENLLAKLRAIDGIKNPPESQPITSAGRGFKQATKSTSSVQSKISSNHGTQSKSTPQSESLPSAKQSESASLHSSTGSSKEPAGIHKNKSKDQNTPRNVSVGKELPLHTTNQSVGSQQSSTGNQVQDIQSLLLGESQPFQSTSQSDSGTKRDPSPPLFGINSNSNATKQSSIFSLTGGQITKGITDLSILRQSSGQAQKTQNEGSEFASMFGASSQQQKPKQEGIISKTSSDSSLHFPDKVHNLHLGKPAYATETDPFGSRRHASEEVSEYKPQHGRRAVTISDNIKAINENHPGILHQGLNLKPRPGNRSYPWEIPIDVQKQEIINQDSQGRSVNEEKINSSRERPLLPLRQRQIGSIGGVGGNSGARPSMELNAVAEPDDLEEVVL